MRCQAADGQPTPVRSKRGAPLPRSSQKILAPKFSTKGMETPDDCRPRGTHWLLREESGAKGLFKQDQNHVGTKGDTRSVAEVRNDRRILLFRLLQGVREGRNDFKNVADHAIVRDFKNGRILVLIDGHDGTGAFHSHDVLYGSADPERQVKFGGDSLPGATDLPFHW